MRRVEGSAGVSLMECTNPVKDKWRIRWDVQEKENGSASYMEEEFGHKPTDEEIRTLVMSWYNSIRFGRSDWRRDPSGYIQIRFG